MEVLPGHWREFFRYTKQIFQLNSFRKRLSKETSDRRTDLFLPTSIQGRIVAQRRATSAIVIVMLFLSISVPVGTALVVVQRHIPYGTPVLVPDGPVQGSGWESMKIPMHH